MLISIMLSIVVEREEIHHVVLFLEIYILV